MSALVVLQARMSSKRFPGKVLEDLGGVPMIIRQIKRIQQAKNIGKIVVATTKDRSDNPLASLLAKEGIEIYRGEIDNVISRFVEVIKKQRATTVVRLTADCPLVMSDLIDQLVEDFWSKDCDYLSNTLNPTFPDGLDVEVFSGAALLKLSHMNLSDGEKEHVTLGFHSRREQFIIHNFQSHVDYSDLRWTVDYPQDLDFVRSVYSQFTDNEDKFNFQEILDLIKKNPSIQGMVAKVLRNESLKEEL